VHPSRAVPEALLVLDPELRAQVEAEGSLRVRNIIGVR
jgi:hypothetical protein